MTESHELAEHFQNLAAGNTAAEATWGRAEVSNAAGKARSHIRLHAKWDVPPEVLFMIFTHPDNSNLFRDIKKIASRNVLSSTPGLKIVEVEQISEFKVLWLKRNYSTWLKVTEDCRNPEHMSVEFELLRSDVLGQFNGRWDIQPIRDATGKITGTIGELNQDVLPKGIPPFLKHVPVMGDMLRGVTMRAITRVMEDMSDAITKVKAEMAKGRTPQAVLRDLCGVANEQGHANGAVASFAVQDDWVPDSEEGSDAGSHRSSHNGNVHAIASGKHQDHAGISVTADSHRVSNGGSSIKKQLIQETGNVDLGHAGSPVIVRAS